MSRVRARAQVELVPTDRGGRIGPILSGYRSLVRFEGMDVDFGFELALEGTGSQELSPGGQATVTMSFWAVDLLPPLVPGLAFELREGARVVGHGSIRERIDVVKTPLEDQ